MAKRPHMDCYAVGDTADFAKTTRFEKRIA